LGAGGTLKDLTQFNTDLTSTIVPQLQNQRFNQLFNASSLGANAASQQGTNALNTASNIGNLLTAQGASAAQGAINQGNALAGGIQNLAGAYGAYSGGGGGVPIDQSIANNPNTLGTITPAY
jgi:hypothetical protein